MEKSQGHPPDNPLDTAGPPGHGSPLDSNVFVSQLPPPAAAEHAAQLKAQPGNKLDPKGAPQPVTEPVYQEYPQPAPMPVYQTSYQYSSQQPQVVQPVSQVVMVQQMPTDCPGQMFCPICKNTVVTKIKHKRGLLSWIICGSLGIIGCWPFCLIPLFVKACQDVEHSCPVCNTVLHTYKHM